VDIFISNEDSKIKLPNIDDSSIILEGFIRAITKDDFGNEIIINTYEEIHKEISLDKFISKLSNYLQEAYDISYKSDKTLSSKDKLQHFIYYFKSLSKDSLENDTIQIGIVFKK